MECWRDKRAGAAIYMAMMMVCLNLDKVLMSDEFSQDVHSFS